MIAFVLDQWGYVVLTKEINPGEIVLHNQTETVHFLKLLY